MSLYLTTIKITLRQSILDPQGNATRHALKSLGFGSVDQVRIGKFIELTVEADDDAAARQTAVQACEKLLANPVMDDFEVLTAVELVVQE